MYQIVEDSEDATAFSCVAAAIRGQEIVEMMGQACVYTTFSDGRVVLVAQDDEGDEIGFIKL